MQNYNASSVLASLDAYIERGVAKPIREVCDELSIFDWWPDKLSVSNAKQMRSFLKTAISLGFSGYVCFKVGASGCSNGMWAHKDESQDGYSPDGDVLYHSFTPDYTCWDASVGSVREYGANFSDLVEGKRFRDITLKDVKELLKDPDALLADYKKKMEEKLKSLYGLDPAKEYRGEK